MKNIIFEEQCDKWYYSVFDTYTNSINRELFESLRKNPPIVYEVYLTIQDGKREDIEWWLIGWKEQGHVDEVVSMWDLFFWAEVLRTDPESHKDDLIVHYYLDTENQLIKYIENYAPIMRNKIPANLQGTFTAKRRKWILQENEKYERIEL